MRKKIPQSQKGFTLVELMVALTLFTIVVMAAVSSLYSVNNASRKVQAMRSVLDNLNFAVESISRTVRTGTDIVCEGLENRDYPGATGTYNCPFGVGNPTQRILISSTLGTEQLIEYRFGENQQNGNGQLEKRVQDENGNWPDYWISLTSPEIDIENLSFYVDGADLTDGLQPSVMMFVEGVATAGTDNIAPFAVQTYISQRAIE